MKSERKPKLRALRRETYDSPAREHRRRRIRRRGRRAYIRSVYSLPSLATLGNCLCGFGAIYIAAMATTASLVANAVAPPMAVVSRDPWAAAWISHGFAAPAYLIFIAMLFDGIDGRLARFARHTTDFGGQLDSLADVVSFGAAPAFLALQVCKVAGESLHMPVILGELIWAIGALYLSCAALRLARFNVSNEHGEQHHFSFLGLPSPGAAAAVTSLVLMQQDLQYQGFSTLSAICVIALPIVVLCSGLLMVSTIRYPHLVNRHLRGRKSIARLVMILVLLLMLVVAHQYIIAACCIAYAFWAPLYWGYWRFIRRRPPIPPAAPVSAIPAESKTPLPARNGLT